VVRTSTFRAERRLTVDEIAVRWGSVEDGGAIGRVLELNSIPERNVLEKAFIVAQEKGEILAVGSYLIARERLVLGSLAVDPWVGKRRFVVSLYTGAGRLAREMGLRKVWTERDEHREYLLEAGYHRHVGGWGLCTTRAFGNYERLPERGWRRILSLWSAESVPFFRAFRA
jgi:N-acetylglutamate synthase-like GNAT family acetyltransferase